MVSKKQNKKKHQKNYKTDVRQRPILGPLLFLCINDLQFASDLFERNMFAGDTDLPYSSSIPKRKP